MARRIKRRKRQTRDDADIGTLAPDPGDAQEPAEDAADDQDTEDDPRGELFPRTQELATPDSQVLADLLEGYDAIQLGFINQVDRVNRTMDYWDLYNCELGSHQTYNGTSQVFVPIVRNAVNARTTRFGNQLFPASGRYVEVISSDDQPSNLMSLLEHYVRRAKLRTQVVPALLKAGDVEGQYTVYVDWREIERNVAYRVTVPTKDDDSGEVTGENHDDIEEETIVSGCPHVEVISDSDMLVLPATADSINDALQNGGSVTILRRWSKAKIEKMRDDGELDKAAADRLLQVYGDVLTGTAESQEPYRKQTDAAGIHILDNDNFALVYETWRMLNVGNRRLLCRIYYGSEDLVLSARRNPFWSDRCPLLSVPVEKVHNSFKGKSLVEPCETMQYAANDAVNEGMDSAAYALMPIILTDPTKNPRVGSMVLNMAAIWEVDPQSTQFAKFPDIWKDAFAIVNAHKQEIFQTLSVSPAILPQSGQLRTRLNQAEIANEQQVDLLTTAEAVTVLEEGIFTPMMNMFAELDHQFRDKEITVRQFGEMGLRADMESVPVLQFEKRYEFRWFGVEQARNAQAIQQQIAAMNVIRGIPPQQYPGFTLNLVPIILQLMQNTFGPRLAPTIFKDMKDQLAVDLALETQLMNEGIDMTVHPMDDDMAHLQAHAADLKQNKDPHGVKRIHIMRHLAQQQMKAQQAAMQPGGPMGPPGEPGVPGGSGPGGSQPAPGVAGTPRIGGQPGMPHGGQNPPGAVHPDQMRDPSVMPRQHMSNGA